MFESPRRRIAVFLAALAAVFGVAYGVGAATVTGTGPGTDAPQPTLHEEHSE